RDSSAAPAPTPATGGGSHDETNFAAGWAGSGHRLSTLRPGSRLPGRKTRFRLLARLYRVGSLSHWVPPKGFELFLHLSSLPRLSLAQARVGPTKPRSIRSIPPKRAKVAAPLGLKPMPILLP